MFQALGDEPSRIKPLAEIHDRDAVILDTLIDTVSHFKRAGKSLTAAQMLLYLLVARHGSDKSVREFAGMAGMSESSASYAFKALEEGAFDLVEEIHSPTSARVRPRRLTRDGLVVLTALRSGMENLALRLQGHRGERDIQ